MGAVWSKWELNAEGNEWVKIVPRLHNPVPQLNNYSEIPEITI